MKRKSTLSVIAFGLFYMSSLCVNGQVLNEGFESGCPPTGWTIDNPDGLVTFVVATNAANSGVQSAFLDVYNMTAAEQGQTDALITSALDLSTTGSSSMTFYYAYQMYSDTSTYTSADALNVYASTDGGATWNSIYSKTGNILVTAVIPFDPNNGYVPVSGDWRMETVDISSVATSSSVQFKFEFLNDYENNFYIDDIVINGGTTGIKNMEADSYVSVIPNPATGPVFVDLSAFGLGRTTINVYNIFGEEVEHASTNVVTPKRVKINLENQSNGIYFVQVKTENGRTSTKKLILNK